MPPRPAGTDGSDWSYREIVEDRYKRMAVNMSATFFLHQLHSVVLLLKIMWYLIPVVMEERHPDAFVYPLLVFLVIGNVCFYAGKPRGRCVLPLMKVAALLVMGTVALHFVSMWRYHILDPKTKQLPRRLFKQLKDQGSIVSPAWLHAFTALETVLDGAVGLSAGVCFFTFNNWVRDGMEVAKEREQRKKAAVEATPIRPPPGAIRKRK